MNDVKCDQLGFGSLFLINLLQERDNYNNIIAENTEKHLTNLCQTLTNQLEDVRLQLRLSEEKCKRFEYEQAAKNDKLDAFA